MLKRKQELGIRKHEVRDVKRGGFTLIEVIVVSALTAFLLSLSLGYTRSSETQLLLFSEQAKVAGVVNRAKSLALRKYREEGAGAVCGYGVAFSLPRTIVIFGEARTNDASQGTCVGSGQYEPSEAEETVALDPRISFSGVPESVIFLSPYLDVQRQPGDVPSVIALRPASGGGGASQVEVLIGAAGDVTLR